MAKCLVLPVEGLDEKIAEAFADAVAECEYAS
jgi:hypothetical protein